MNFKNKKVQISLNVFIVLLFGVLGIVFGQYHEPWADEAQSWLIAKDTTWANFLNVTQLEGTPPLWHLLLKGFILLGLDYQHLYIAPLVISLIGVVILVFLLDAPFYFKALFPFTYYVVYFNAEIARNYCLLFPIFMLMIFAYQKIDKHVWLYYISIGLLAFVNSYGIVMSGSLMFAEFVQALIDIKNKRFSYNRKRLLWFIAAGVIILCAFITILPSDEMLYKLLGANTSFFGIICATFFAPVKSAVLQAVIALILIIAFFVYIGRDKALNTLLCVLPVVIFLSFFHSRPWHYNTLFFYVIALIFIKKDDGKLIKDGSKKTLILKGFFICFLAAQVFFGGYAIYKDCRYSYSGTEAAAEYIKENVTEQDAVFAVDYYATGIQPYFDRNIYCNHKGSERYYLWSVNNGYNDNNSPGGASDELYNSDCYVCEKENRTYVSQDYEEIVFKGMMFNKGFDDKDTSISIWVKKD